MGDEGTDLDPMLPGEAESIGSRNTDDAKVWFDVYTELSAFKQNLLTELHEQSHKVGLEGEPEVRRDEVLLRLEADRLQRRLNFWRTELDRRRGGGPHRRS